MGWNCEKKIKSSKISSCEGNFYPKKPQKCFWGKHLKNIISSQKFYPTWIGSSGISGVIRGQWGHLGLVSLVPFPLIYPISLFPALWLVLTIEFFETAASPNNAYSGPGAFETLNLQVDIVSEDEKIFDFMFWGRRRGKNVRIIP